MTAIDPDLQERLTAAVRAEATRYDGLGDFGPHEQEQVAVDLPDGTYRVPPTTVRICARGCHLVVAHRWETRCDRCHQSIRSGAVGLHTHLGEPPNPCIDGAIDWQHGCGEWMPPTEHIIDLDDYDDAVEQEDEADRETDEAMADLAHEIVAGAIVALHTEIADEQREAAEEVRRRLLADLHEALLALRDGAEPDDVATGSDWDPGVAYDELMDEWVAWAPDPQHPDGEPIVVTASDFDLVGVAEVARIAGLSEASVRTYVRRGAIVAPVPVAGSDALVWRRADVEEWAQARPGRGRPRG